LAELDSRLAVSEEGRSMVRPITQADAVLAVYYEEGLIPVSGEVTDGEIEIKALERFWEEPCRWRRPTTVP
jgi:hypothetical protein